MKKSSWHFKAAAWSIKNPTYTYIGVGVVITMLIAISMGTTYVIQKPGKSRSPVSMTIEKKAVLLQGFEREGWNITSQRTVGVLECVSYKRESNATRMTSCYEKMNDGWIFRKSY